MLIVKKLHTKFPQRVVEWGLCWILLTWGSVLLLNPGLFAKGETAYRGWASLAPQPVWGFFAFAVGMGRMSALYINGAHSKSPVARTFFGFCSMAIWFWATVGVLRMEPSTALCAYPWFMVGDGYAVYVSSGDAYQSLHKEKKAHARTRSVFGSH